MNGLPTEVKVLECFMYLESGRSFDYLDDKYRMGADNLIQYMHHFCADNCDLYGNMYHNRRPGMGELARIE